MPRKPTRTDCLASSPKRTSSSKSPPRVVLYSQDSLSEHAAAVNALVAARPFNANPPVEFRRGGALMPPVGETASPTAPATVASTGSETDGSV